MTQNLSNINVENFIVLVFFPLHSKFVLKAWKFQVPNIDSSDLRGRLKLHLDCFYLLAVKIPRYFFLQSVVRLKRFALWLARRIALVLAWTIGVNGVFKQFPAIWAPLMTTVSTLLNKLLQLCFHYTQLAANDDPTTNVIVVVKLQQALNWKSHDYLSAEFISIKDYTNRCRNSFTERKIMLDRIIAN